MYYETRPLQAGLTQVEPKETVLRAPFFRALLQRDLCVHDQKSAHNTLARKENVLKQVIDSYRFALERWLPLIAAHGFIRLFVSSVMVPIVALGLAITLLASDQAALTDQDIARFLITPAGAIGALILVSLLLVAIVLDVVVATAILRQDTRRPVRALRLAARFAIYSAPRLLPFMARFLI
ncbi:MAG: hypothetical protein AB3N11_07975, partial [Arenibacterium sp.]